MEICEILIVEDDEPLVESWKRDIREFNRGNDVPFHFNATYALNKEDALYQLSRLHVDCAVIDLRIPDRAGAIQNGESLGNDILQEMLHKVGIPAVVYSGHGEDVSEAVRESHIQVITKDGLGAAEILARFASQSTLILAMADARQRIAKETASLFYKSIWRRWETRWGTENREMISDVIARQTASHVADQLGMPPVNHHPDEFYIVPPLFSDRLDTGDLLQIGEQVLVVLTPRCNMANGRQPEYILVAVCVVVPNWTELRNDLNSGAAKRERAQEKLRKLATQNLPISKHFLPPLDERGPWTVNFEEVRTISPAEKEAALNGRMASIAPHFVPNLVQRYSSYLGRIGQPDICPEMLADICKG